MSLVSVPTSPGFQQVDFNIMDAVALSTSPFTGQTQAQQWPGADSWVGTLTLPPLTQSQADDWIAFLMECRGMANAFQIGDPFKKMPRGPVIGSAPMVDMTTGISGANLAMTQTLYTRNWATNKFRILVPGDYLQCGYRLHRVINPVNTDVNGKAAISVWPSIREVPTDGEPVNLNKPVGLFRLGANKRTWSVGESRTTRISIQILEYR